MSCHAARWQAGATAPRSFQSQDNNLGTKLLVLSAPAEGSKDSQLTAPATAVIPHNEYAEKAARSSPRAPERTTRASYAEAAAICRTKVRKIADECRAINRKYRDPHFDLEADLKLGHRDCLESLSNQRAGSGDDDEPDAPPLKPMGVKRVADIFDEPSFFIDGPSTNDVRQGKGGDCWLLA